MSLVFKRFVTNNLEKTLYDAFLNEKRSLNKSFKLYNPNKLSDDSHTESRNSSNLQNIRSISDKWLHDALNTKVESKGTEIVTLQLPIILKTLQKLRSNNDVKLYFKLMKKLNSANVNWVRTNHKSVINIKAEQKIPIEFIHELSNMLYKIALRLKYYKNENEINTLTKFSLKLLSDYLDLLAPIGTEPNIKFLKQIISVIMRSKSYALKSELLKVLDNYKLRNNGFRSIYFIIDYINVSFFYETDQVLQLEDYINKCIIPKQSYISKDLSSQQIEMFTPLFVKILKKYILCDMEEASLKLTDEMINKWGIKLYEHDIYTLKELCDRDSFTAVSENFNSAFSLRNNDAFDNLRKFLINEKLSFKSLLMKLQEANINTDDAKYFDLLNFAIFKVEGTEKRDVMYWGEELPNILIDFKNNSTPEHIQKFFLNTLITHIAGEKHIGYLLSVLEILYQDLEYELPISKCQQPFAVSSTGYHPFLPILKRGSSPLLTSLELFYFLLRLSAAGKYQFSIEDFSYLFKISIKMKDRILFNYYFCHFIQLHGHEYFETTSETWKLPEELDWIIDLELSLGVDAIKLEQISEFYKKNGGKKLSLSEGESMSEIFDPNFSKLLNIKHDNGVDSFKRKLKAKLGKRMMTSEDYDYNTDISNSERLMDILENMEKNSFAR